MFLQKHKTLALLFLFCVFSKTSFSQVTDYFIKSYKLQANAYGGNIVELNDEGFINSAANIDTVAIAPGDTVIIEVISMYRVNRHGTLTWAKNYILSSQCAYGGSFCLSKDSTIAVASVSTDSLGFNPDYLFFKADLNGNYLMSNAIGTLGNEYAMDIKQLSNENYLICGYSDGNSMNANNGDYNLVKLSKNGSLIFSKVYYDGNISYDFPVGLEIDMNENCYLYGNTQYSDSIGYYNGGQIVKTDNNGVLTSLIKYCPMPIPLKITDYYVTAATITKSNKLAVIGYYSIADTVGGNYLYTNYSTLTMFNANGTIDFAKKYEIPNQKNSYVSFGGIKQTTNRDLLVAFDAYDSLYNQLDGLLLIDTMGNIKNTKLIPKNTYLTKISNIKNNSFVASGIDYNTGNSLIAKLDSNLNISCQKDTSLFLESTLNFSTSIGGLTSNLGTQHPSGVIASSKYVGDTTYCQKTVVILTPTSTIVSVPQTEVVIEIPNVFTPNNDGRNEYFGVKSNYPLDDFHLIIYDRWGLKVFESTNYQEFWNGNYLQNGASCTDGTYFFIVNFSVLNESKKEHGFLTLLR